MTSRKLGYQLGKSTGNGDSENGAVMYIMVQYSWMKDSKERKVLLIA